MVVEGNEDNVRNPTIARVKSKSVKNSFVIKYKTEEQKVAWAELVLRVAQNHELMKDLHIEEQEAYEEPRVLYNLHTVLKEGEFSFDLLEKRFLKHYEG